MSLIRLRRGLFGDSYHRRVHLVRDVEPERDLLVHGEPSDLLPHRELPARPSVLVEHQPSLQQRALLDRLAPATPETLAARTAELPDWDFDDGGEDLEGGLDALRLLRREETLVAACLHLGGLADLESLAIDVQRLGYVTLKKLRALSRTQSVMAGCVTA